MRIFIINACLFLLLVCNLSCKKNKEYVSGGTLLSKVVYTQTSNGTTSTSTVDYTYNSDTQLVSITSDNNVTNSFEYNSGGQLISAKNFISPQNPQDIATFVLDTQGKIAQRIDSPILANLGANNHHYAYDLNNNIIADSLPNLVTPSTIAVFDIYAYDAKGNVAKVSSYEYSTGSAILSRTAEHTYSDIPNPYYYNRAALYFGAGSSINYLSKNLETVQTGASYSFYTNGLLREAVYHSTGSSGVSTNVVDYFYK